VIAIWLPMLAGDARSSWDSHVLDDPRVVQFWDGKRIAGTWFANHDIGGITSPGYVVWDAYYAFPKTAAWTSAPTDLLVSGSDIIDNTRGLEQRLLPLL
jgi:hypothetical protein